MLKYQISGDSQGDLIVFINGAGVGTWIWKEQIEYFHNYKCITFDLPGHGENSNIPFKTIDHCSRMIARIIEKESFSGKAVLTGLSIGAQIIMFMMEKYADLLESSVIISGLNKPMRIPAIVLKWTFLPFMPLISLKSFARLQAKELRLPVSLFEKYYSDSLKISSGDFISIITENMHFEFAGNCPEEIKTIVLVGKEEKKIMVKSALKTGSSIKGSQVFSVEGAGHGIPYEKGALLNRTIESFINNTSVEETGLHRLL